MHNKRYSVKRYVAIMIVIIVLVTQCIGLNANVVIGNAESKNASTTDDAMVINEVGEDLNADDSGEVSNNSSESNNYDIGNIIGSDQNKENENNQDTGNITTKADGNQQIEENQVTSEINTLENDLADSCQLIAEEDGEGELPIKDFDIQDADGNSLKDGKVIPRDSPVKLVYYFEISKGTKISSFSMCIGSSILIKQEMNADLIIDEEKIGEAIFKTDNTVEVTFEKDTFTSNLKGSFYIETCLNTDAIADGNNVVKVTFNIGDEIKYEIPIKLEEQKPSDDLDCIIIKDKAYDSATQTITWSIYVGGHEDFSEAQIIDELEEHQEFIDNSVVLESNRDKHIDYNYSEDTRTLSIPNLKQLTEAAGGVTILFKTKVDEDFLRNPESSKIIKNKASVRFILNSKPKFKESNEVCVDLAPNLINKTGTWNRQERKIDWEINVNNQKDDEDNNLKLKNVVIKDILPDCIDLYGDIYLDGTKMNTEDYTYRESTHLTAKRDDPVYFPELDHIQTFTYVSDYPEKCGNLEIRLGDIDKNHTIKFSTKIKDELYQHSFWSFVINNISLVTDGDENGNYADTYTYSSNPVYITMSPIHKMAIETADYWVEDGDKIYEEPFHYNPKTHILTWQVVANGDGIPMDKATVIDKLPDGLEFYGNIQVTKILKYDKTVNPHYDKWDYRALIRPDNSIRYFWWNFDYYGIDKPGGQWVDPVNEFSVDYNRENNELEIKINKPFEEAYIFYFATKITDPSIYASNGDLKIKNVAAIKVNDSLDESAESSWITNGNLTKSEMIKLSAVDYDWVSHRIKWSAIVNRNQLNIKNQKIFDEIEENQKYVDGSLKIQKYNGDDSDESIDESKTIYDDSLRVTDEQYIHKDKFIYIPASEHNKESFQYDFGDEYSDEMYLVTFETEVTDSRVYQSNIEKTISNKITLKDAVDEIGVIPAISDTAETNVKSAVIQKKGVAVLLPDNSNRIDWSIAVNINKLYLKNSIIEDKLQEGLSLDEDSIELYHLKINPDGTYSTVGDPISRDEYTVNIPEEQLLDVQLPTNTQEAYMLKFSTKADSKYSPFYNTAYFKGIDENGDIKDDSSNQEKVGVVGSVGAVVQKEEGSISVYAVDDEDNTLSGANFSIYYGGDGESYDSDNEILKDEACVDSNTGMIKFKKLSYGWYKIVETKAPNGYKLSDNMEDRIRYIRVMSQENIKFIFKHSKIEENQTGQIKLFKTDEYGNSLENARYMLKAADGTEQDIQLSDDNGILVFDNVPFGIYSIDEVQAPYGYKLDSAPTELKNIVVSADTKNIDLTVHNNIITEPPIRGSIKITKAAEEDTNIKLEGAEFNLYSSGDYENILSTKVSDSNGIIVFDDLPEGIYDIREISAPDGYEISKAIYKGIVVSSDSGKSVDIVITNKKKQSGNNNDMDKNQGGNSGGTSVGGNTDGCFNKEEEYYEALYNIGQDNSMIKQWINKNEMQGFNKHNSDSLDDTDITDNNDIDKMDEEYIDVSGNESIIPQAGRLIDTKLMIFIGLFFIGLGIYPSVKRFIGNSE